jgi:hypothetical protein
VPAALAESGLLAQPDFESSSQEAQEAPLESVVCQLNRELYCMHSNMHSKNLLSSPPPAIDLGVDETVEQFD